MGRVIFASARRCSAYLYAAGIEPRAAHAGTKKQDDACVMVEEISETRSPTLTQGKHEKRGAKSCICSRGSDICSADISPLRAQTSFCWRIRPSEEQRRRGACTSQTPLRTTLWMAENLIPRIALEERLSLRPPVRPGIVSVIVLVLRTGEGWVYIRLLPVLFLLQFLLLAIVWLPHATSPPDTYLLHTVQSASGLPTAPNRHPSGRRSRLPGWSKTPTPGRAARSR